MTDQELEGLLRHPETDRTERKEAFKNDRDKIRQTVCAFANDLPNHGKPGVIFIGVCDDGTDAELPITDELLRDIADVRSDGNILPFPMMTVQEKTLAGMHLVVMVVQPAQAPPVRYKNRVYVRVGPSCRIATAEEEKRLAEKRLAGDLPFDLRPVISASLDDLDISYFEQEFLPAVLPADVVAANHRSTDEQLMAMRLTTVEPPGHPTVLGLLVLGKSPTFAIPGDYVQFLRIDGTDLTDPIRDQRELGGPVANILYALDELFRANISMSSDITSGTTEIRRPDYPLVALQQIARNAIIHRDYEMSNAPVRITWLSDRVEISNPGGPYGQVTRLNFGVSGVTDYRNPHLAAALKDLGFVQRFGVGIASARRALKDNGNPDLEFNVQDTYVAATLKKDAPGELSVRGGS